MKKNEHADSLKRSDLLRQKNQRKRSKWLHRVNSRAEQMASRPAYKAYEENQQGSRAHATEKNPLARISVNDKQYPMLKLHLSWRFLSAIIAAACSLTLLSAWRSPRYCINDIQINGIQRVKEEEVLSVLHIDQQRIFLLSPQALEQSISENFPELYDIQITLSLSDKVKVNVKERQPFLNWSYQGKSLWIDPDGYLLPVRGNASITLTIEANEEPPFFIPAQRVILHGEKRLYKTIIVKGDNDPLALFKVYQQIEPITYQAIKDLHQLLPEQSIILYDPSQGLGWNDARGFTVYVGTEMRNITTKISMLEEIVKTLTSASIQPAMISIEQMNAPYYRVD